MTAPTPFPPEIPDGAAAPDFEIPVWSIPIGAPAAWTSAVNTACGQCECEGIPERDHGHKRAGGRCPTRQGVNGGRLILHTDGRAVCEKCAAEADRLAKKKAEAAPAAEGVEQLDLFGAAT